MQGAAEYTKAVKQMKGPRLGRDQKKSKFK